MTKDRGFTLIELLVVVLIIGIASTIIAVKASLYSNNNKSPNRLANDIAAHIKLAKIQAIFSMTMLGVRLEGNRYSIVQLVEGNKTLQWQPLSQIDPFWDSQSLPNAMIIQIKNMEPMDKDFKKIPNAPQILIYPSGEISPFTLSIKTVGAQNSTEIDGNGAGEIHVMGKDN